MNVSPVDWPVLVGRQEGLRAAARAAFIESRSLYDIVAQVIVIKQKSLK
jgi:hypothetical protein